jgi:PPOX class probable F420-dependent enzyme
MVTMGFQIDTTTELGAKVFERVEHQLLAWLTTVAADGTPQPNPVWFIRDGESFIVFSKPGQAKLANIKRHPQVSFNLEATADEEQITIFTGTAIEIDRATLGPDVLDRYAARYQQGMINIKMTRAEYEAAYEVVVRITPVKLRGW